MMRLAALRRPVVHTVQRRGFAGHGHAPPPVAAGGLFASDPSPPTHRWMLLGAEGSGTPLHVDPLATSAWNALVSGAKLWALFPPASRRADAHLDGGRTPRECDAMLSASASRRACGGARAVSSACAPPTPTARPSARTAAPATRGSRPRARVARPTPSRRLE